MLRTLTMMALLAVAGCSPNPETTAKALIAHDLRDPESAKYRDVSVISEGKCVTGEMNSRNALGGYAGFKPFIVNVETSSITIQGMNSDDAVDKARWALIASSCGLKN